MKSKLNHVAILVKSIQKIIQSNLFSNHDIGPIENFESEGTKEVYIGPKDHSAKLLLLEATSQGPYLNALQKRGTGLHHICIDVPNIQTFLQTISGSGWYLHPNSLDLYQTCQQVFLARPGIATLIEVNQCDTSSKKLQYIVEMSFPFTNQKLKNALLCDSIKTGDQTILTLHNQQIYLEDILNIT